ncbi:cytochrome P450 [Ancistrocladus abbreviatus]
MSPLELTSYSLLSLIFLYFIFSLLLRRPKALPPGPKPWPIVGNLPHLGAMPHKGLADMARKYGPLMYLRLGYVDVVVAASASTAAQFLKTHDSNFSSRPPIAGGKHLAYNCQDLVFAPYGPKWRFLRKICSVHLFSAKALDDFRHLRQEEVGIMTMTLANAGKTKKPVEVGQLINMCVTNALARLMLGKRVFSDGTGTGDLKSDEFKEMVTEIMVLSGVFNIGDFVPALDWLDLQGVVAKMKKLHRRFDKFLVVILEEHKLEARVGRDKQQHTDLLSILLSLKDDFDGEGGKLTDTEIKALLLDLFAAGTDTSSSTVEWGLAELIHHPKVLAQVQQELDSIVGRERLVSELDLPQLTFFQAVIKEVFRLHPSDPLSVPRKATESCEINGYHIPKGSTLLVNVWAISHDPEVWADPLEFRPSRFLPGGERPNADVRGNDFEVIPFGAGRRICAGLNLGIRMVQLLIATLVQAFDWELADGQVPEKLSMEEAYGFSLRRKVPLMVHPRPRLSPSAY